MVRELQVRHAAAMHCRISSIQYSTVPAVTTNQLQANLQTVRSLAIKLIFHMVIPYTYRINLGGRPFLCFEIDSPYNTINVVALLA